MFRRYCLALAALVLLALPAVAAEFSRDLQTDAQELVLRNLVGRVTVLPASGDQYQVTVHVRGKDADPSLITVELEDGKQAELQIVFPIDEHRDYVYPELSGDRTTISRPGSDPDDNSVLRKIWRSISGDRVTVRRDGRGLEVWADVEVRVPAGRQTSIYLAAGNLDANDVQGTLVLDTSSGPVTAQRHQGRLVCDTGSGSVSVDDVDGSLLADTGSGSVVVKNQRGGACKVDTGSGSVRIDGADTDDLYVDTGSGSVRARGIKADKARIDTGSGSVLLELDRMGTGKFVVDTGSGGVELVIPGDASATIDVDTGSGGIRNRVAGAEVVREGRSSMTLRVGEGTARVTLDTGSGSVTVASR
jgi:hypothetical protein